MLTADKQNMTVDSYVLWRVTDPLRFFQTLGSVGVAEERLDAMTYNAQDVMGTLAQKDIINEDAMMSATTSTPASPPTWLLSPGRTASRWWTSR